MNVRQEFALAEGIEAEALNQSFRAAGRVRIQPFLREEQAVALHSHLKRRSDWVQVIAGREAAIELTRAARAALPLDQAAALDGAVRAEARYGFQYRYDTIRVSDLATMRERSDDPLARLAQFLSGNAVLDLLRRVADANDVTFADAQATAYGPGDFLTAHDDEVAGKLRRAAFVLNLCPAWRPEWGGLLLFHGADGQMEGWAPGMNALTLFAVPSAHSVSEVVAQASVRRYSVTGWLRAGAVP